LKAVCSDCQRAYEEMWRAKNRERLVAARASRRAKDQEYRKQYVEAHRAEYLVCGMRTRSIKKGMEFDLDKHVEALNARIRRGVCELTGLPLRLTHGRRQWDSPSIDRIDPNRGYIYSNVRVVCFAVNAAMGDWGEAVLKKIASAYLERNP